MARAILCLAVWCLLAVLSRVSGNGSCNPRDYGYGAQVCVCSEQKPCPDLNVKITKDHGVITSYSTNKRGARFLHREYRFLNETPQQNFDLTVEVNRGKRFQKILGFGGAFTDSTGLNIKTLKSEKLQKRIIEDYFGDSGLEYRMGRIPVGGADFSTRAYSYDDHADDDTLSKWALQPEDEQYKLPYLRMAQEVSSHQNQLKFFGSSWSSPAWMKTNKMFKNGGWLIGQPGTKYYQLFARYMIKFLDAYKKNKVPIWGLTVENEPQFGWKADYWFNCLGFNGTLERDYVKMDLGPELARSGYEHLQLMIYDDNIHIDNKTGANNIGQFVDTVLTDKDANKYTSGIAFHWYTNIIPNSRDHLDAIAHRFPDKFLLSTEACMTRDGSKDHVQLGDWTAFEQYAEDIIQDLNHYASGWVDWNMVLDLQGGPNWVNNFVDAPIIVNATAQEYYRQPMFYALGHFSKFITPDSVRLENNGANSDKKNIVVTVFERPDKSTVATILNKNNHTVMVQLHDPVQGYLATDVMANSLETFVWY